MELKFRDVDVYFSWLRSRRCETIAEQQLTLAETIVLENVVSLRKMKEKEKKQILGYFIRGGVEKHSAWQIVLNINRFWRQRNRQDGKLGQYK